MKKINWKNWKLQRQRNSYDMKDLRTTIALAFFVWFFATLAYAGTTVLASILILGLYLTTLSDWIVAEIMHLLGREVTRESKATDYLADLHDKLIRKVYR